MVFRIIVPVGLLVVLSAFGQGNPEDWKRVTDAKKQCQIRVPNDWITDDIVSGQASAPGKYGRAFVHRVMPEFMTFSTVVANAKRQNKPLNIVEEKPNRLIYFYRPLTRGRGFYAAVSGSGYVCEVSIEINAVMLEQMAERIAGTLRVGVGADPPAPKKSVAVKSGIEEASGGGGAKAAPAKAGEDGAARKAAAAKKTSDEVSADPDKPAPVKKWSAKKKAVSADGAVAAGAPEKPAPVKKRVAKKAPAAPGGDPDKPAEAKATPAADNAGGPSDKPAPVKKRPARKKAAPKKAPEDVPVVAPPAAQ